MRLLLIAIVAVVWSVGCSYPKLEFEASEGFDAAVVDTAGTDVADTGDGRPPTMEEACQQYAEVWCARLEECGPGELVTKYGSRGACASAFALHCVSIDGAKSAPTRTPSQVAACAAARATTSCGNLYEDSVGCETVPGTLPTSAKCAFDEQCAGGACNYTGSSCGLCAAAPVRRGLGQACTTGAECVPVLVCRAGKCAEPRGLGEACTAGPSDDCGRFQARYCDTTSKTCKGYSYAEDGATCGELAGQWWLCRAGVCSAPSGGISTCYASAGAGGSCSDRACLFPWRCVGVLCVLPDPTKC